MKANSIPELIGIMGKMGEDHAKTIKTTKSPDETTLRYALRAMGNYFDLPEKGVKFFIRQMELSEKLPKNDEPFIDAQTIGAYCETSRFRVKQMSLLESAFRAGYATNNINDQIELDQAWEEFMAKLINQ